MMSDKEEAEQGGRDGQAVEGEEGIRPSEEGDSGTEAGESGVQQGKQDDVIVKVEGERDEATGAPAEGPAEAGTDDADADSEHGVEWSATRDADRMFGYDEFTHEEEDELDDDDEPANTDLHGPSMTKPEGVEWKVAAGCAAAAAAFSLLACIVMVSITGNFEASWTLLLPAAISLLLINMLVFPTRRYHHIRIYLLRRWLRFCAQCWGSGCRRPSAPASFAASGVTADDLEDDEDLIVLDSQGRPVRVDTSAHWFALFHSALLGFYLAMPVLLVEFMLWGGSYLVVQYAPGGMRTVMEWMLFLLHLLAVSPVLHVFPLDLMIYLPRRKKRKAADEESPETLEATDTAATGGVKVFLKRVFGLNCYLDASTTPRCTRGLMFGGALGAGIGCGLALARQLYALYIGADADTAYYKMMPGIVSAVSTGLDTSMYVWCGAWIGLTHTNHKMKRIPRMWKRIMAMWIVMGVFYWVEGVLSIIAYHKTGDATNEHIYLWGPFVFTQLHWVFLVSVGFSLVFIVVGFCFLAAYHKYLLTDGYERLSMADVGAAFASEDDDDVLRVNM